MMMVEKDNYSPVDYSKLKKDREEFHQVAEMVSLAPAALGSGNLK